MKRNKVVLGLILSSLLILTMSQDSLAASLNQKYQNVDLTKNLEPDLSYLSIEDYKESKRDTNTEVRKYLNKYNESINSLVGDTEIPATYNLADHISINAENQNGSNWCWVFAGLKCVETNLALKGNGNYNFSEAHAAYMTSKDLGGKRNVSFEDVFDYTGNFLRLSEYFGTERFSKAAGPVLESTIPNKAYTKDSINTLVSAKPVVRVNSIEKFPNLLVSYGKKADEISESEILEVRNAVKRHIMANGSVFASICIPDDVQQSTMLGNNYSYCKLESDLDDLPNHGVAIIGWDDNYSKNNFKVDNRPDNDGAYICLNSWGSSWGDNGCFYVSYEDAFIENMMYGVNSVSTEYEDTEAPSVVYSKTSDDKIKVDVYDVGGSGVNSNSLKYAKSITGVQPDLSTFTPFTNGTSFNMDKDYLWIYSEDTLGNKSVSSIGNVYFKDANLYKTIQSNSLDLMNVMDSDDISQKVLIGNIENVNELYLMFGTVSDLSGVENFYNLVELYASYNDISDLTPISKLNSLEIILINTNKIKSLTPIANLTKLKKLDLANNPDITDLTLLGNLSNLQMLNLENCNKITNASSIGKLTKLTTLYINSCNLTDVRFLSTLKQLENLDIDNNNLKDISCINNLIYLTSLDISRNPIGNLESIKNLRALQILNANTCNLIDVSVLAGLNNLNMVSLSNNKIYDLSSLDNCGIKSLYLKNQNITVSIMPNNTTNQVVELPQICKFIADRAINHGENAKITLTNAKVGTKDNTIIVDSTDTEKSVRAEVTGGSCDGTKIYFIYNDSPVDIKCTKITNNEWEQVQKVQVEVTPLNNNTILGLQYAWSKDKLDANSIKTAFVNNSILSTPENVNGEYYLNILVTLKSSEGTNDTYLYTYGKVCVDNTVPESPKITANIDNGGTTDKDVTLNIGTVSNTLSGIHEYQISLDNGTTWTSITNNVATVNKVGNFSAIARAISNTGVISKASEPFTFTIENSEIELGKITYSTTEVTNQDVVATISFVDPTIKVTNNNGSTKYTFTKNGEFIFEYEDTNGHKGYATAKVNNIRKDIPEATIKYSITELTNKDVEATLIFADDNTKGITVTNNDGKFVHTFTENGKFTFEYQDEYGNKGTCEAVVDNIDKVPAKAILKYSTDVPTNEYVTVELSFAEDGVVITNNDGDKTHVFTENGEFTFEYIDTLGNVGKAVAKVSNIDKEAPIATVTYSTEEVTKDNVEVTIKFNEENVVITNNRGFNRYTFTENGSFTFEYVDAAGNKGSTTVEVDNIDKSVTGVTKLPDTGLHIAIIFGVILVLIARFAVANKDELEKVWILYKNRREFNHNNNR